MTAGPTRYDTGPTIYNPDTIELPKSRRQKNIERIAQKAEAAQKRGNWK